MNTGFADFFHTKTEIKKPIPKKTKVIKRKRKCKKKNDPKITLLNFYSVKSSSDEKTTQSQNLVASETNAEFLKYEREGFSNLFSSSKKKKNRSF